MVQILIKKLANIKATVNISGHKSKSYGFYTKRTANSVAKIISNTICSTSNNKKVSVSILFQKSNKCSKLTCYTHLETPEQVAQEIMGWVRSDTLSLDVKTTRFTLRIRNNISFETDTKDVSFNDTKKFDDVFSFIRFLAEQIETQTKKSMLYISDNPIKSSHTIILMRTGNSQRLSQSSKSFSINIPYFSSKEIAEMFSMGGKNGNK